jgi:glycosyltransferase involved in cell wall biosynthesis
MKLHGPQFLDVRCETPGCAKETREGLRRGSLTKQVYLEPVWKLHSLYREHIDFPPQGYEFVSSQPITAGLLGGVSKAATSYSLQRQLSRIMPLALIKSYLDSLRATPSQADLTFACEHLVLRKEPWVVDVGCLTNFVAGDYQHFRRYRGIIERTLGSPWCKRILCWSEFAKESLLGNLDGSRFEHKIELIPLAKRSRDFVKNHDEGRVKLLFVNSANILAQFDAKGGKELLEAFVLLTHRYDNLELTLRSDLPVALKRRYQGVRGLRIVDRVVPWGELEQEFMSADIFVMPSYTGVGSSILEAMSYELPIVTTNVYHQPEVVEDGKTGLLVEKSGRVPWYVNGSIPNDPLHPSFLRAIRTVDHRVVQQLVEKVSVLIENAELRRSMGTAGRWEVEHGKFSIERRNEKLKRVLDECTTQARNGAVVA